MMIRMINNNNRMKSKSKPKSNNSNSSSSHQHQHQYQPELVKKKQKKKDGPYSMSLRIFLLYLVVGCVDGIWTSTTTTTTNREGSGILQDEKEGHSSSTSDGDDDDENIHKGVIQEEPFMVKYQDYLHPRPVVGGGGGGRMDRMLQSSNTTSSSTTTTTTTTCSNVSESFRTTVIFAYQGNKSLLTEQQLNLLGEIFGITYNSLTTSTDDGSSDGSIFCDPLFRTITSVQATSNVSFTGRTQNGEVVNIPLPIIPVRKRRLDERKHKQRHQQRRQQQQEEDSSSTLLNDILWKSLAKAGLVDDEMNNDKDIINDPFQFLRGLQQPQLQLDGITQQQQQQQQPQQGGVTGSSNRTVASFDVGLILLDIFGACRGCQGNSPSFSLFDDTSDRRRLQQKLQKHRQQQQQQRQQSQLRGLQDQQTPGEGNNGGEEKNTTTDDCTCTAAETLETDTVSIFETSLTDNIETLQDSGEIDFVEEVNEIIEVTETQCPTKDQDFSTIHLISGMEFSSRILFNLGNKGARDVETLFRDSYNGLAQQLCDPLYRAVSKSQFVSIIEDDDSSSSGSSSSLVTFEFLAEATCRGDDCTNYGCIFDDSDDCQERRRRQLAATILGGPEQLALEEEDEEELNFARSLLPLPDSKIDLPGSIRPTMESYGSSLEKASFEYRMLMNEEEVEEEEAERCFCRKARSERPPTQNEFNRVFQKGLDKIMEENRLLSCQACDVSSDCQSDVCLEGQCAEQDTKLLQNGCGCNIDSLCESGFCTSGVCTAGRGCGELLDGLIQTGCDCQSNSQCQSGRCVRDFSAVGGVAGECTAKIIDTCTQPCLLPNDCVSGKCGSVVCLPNNDTLLPDGCSALVGFECESSRSKNNVCVPLGGLCEVCSAGTDCNTGQCTNGRCADSNSKLPNDCSCLEDSDCASGSCQSGTCTPLTAGVPTATPSSNPSSKPTAKPSSEPSSKPTAKPSSKPSSEPSTSPTTAPSSPPTLSPSTAPSTSPSSTPTTAPSSPPTLSPSTPPTTSPSSTPTTAPSSTPTLSPSTPPTTSPSSTPTTAPSSPPTLSPSTPPTTSPSSTPTTAPTLSPSAFPTEFCPFTPLPPDSELPNVSGIWEWLAEPGVAGVCFTQTGADIVAIGLPDDYTWDTGYGVVTSDNYIALDLYKDGNKVQILRGTVIGENDNRIDWGNFNIWIRQSPI